MACIKFTKTKQETWSISKTLKISSFWLSYKHIRKFSLAALSFIHIKINYLQNRLVMYIYFWLFSVVGKNGFSQIKFRCIVIIEKLQKFYSMSTNSKESCKILKYFIPALYEKSLNLIDGLFLIWKIFHRKATSQTTSDKVSPHTHTRQLPFSHLKKRLTST